MRFVVRVVVYLAVSSSSLLAAGCTGNIGADATASGGLAGSPGSSGAAGSPTAAGGTDSTQAGQDSGGTQPGPGSGGALGNGSSGGGTGGTTSGDVNVPYTGAPDPRDAVIYQVNLRAFSSKGFQGVTERLDQIRALGVNVVYLMPVTPVGLVKTANSPFCVRNYKEVNPEFGTLEELRTLIAESHQRGMAVILDWVANHTAWDNPWITEHPDWYERDANGVIQPGKVNNFVWEDVAKLDFANQDMRAGMIDALKYWITTVGNDGYRFDFTDGPPIDFWIQANGSLRSSTAQRLILYAEGGRQDNYQAFDYNHGFSFYDALRQMFGGDQAPATRVENENDAQYRSAGDFNRLVRYVTNHDVNGWDGVPQNLFGGQAGAIAAFVIAAYNRGVPLIYNGQEIALGYPLLFPFTEQKIQWTPNQPVTDEYTKLIRLYNQSAAIRRGMPTSYSNHDVSAFVKESDGDKVLVVVNIRNRRLTFNLPANLVSTTWYSAFDKSEVEPASAIELEPYQYLAMTAAPLP
jgi:glycosidase